MAFSVLYRQPAKLKVDGSIPARRASPEKEGWGMRNGAWWVGVVVLAWLGLTAAGASGANLTPGDLAFVGYQMAGSTDRVAFVTLVELPPGTAVSLNDNAWNSTSNTFRGATEDTVVWSNDTGVAIAPTNVTIEGSNASVGRIISGKLNLSDSGDSILAYQGPTNSPVFLAGINSSAWTTSPPTQSEECNLPDKLSLGVHACMFTNKKSNGFYVGTLTSASREGLLTAINNQASWVRTTTTQIWPTWAFTLKATSPLLAAGDVAVVGFQTSTFTTDRFAFAALRRLPGCAEVAFTDNGWTGTNLMTTKRTVVWQAPATGMARGGVVRVESGQASIGTVSGNLTLCPGGDQILAFQRTVTNPVFLSAVSGTPWLTNGVSNDHYSWPPAGLTDGVNALAFAINPTNALCPGRSFADAAAMRAWIYAASNWTSASATQAWPAIWEFRLCTSIRFY